MQKLQSNPIFDFDFVILEFTGIGIRNIALILKRLNEIQV